MSDKYKWMDGMSEEQDRRVRQLIAHGVMLLYDIDRSTDILTGHDAPAEFRCGQAYSELMLNYSDAWNVFNNDMDIPVV